MKVIFLIWLILSGFAGISQQHFNLYFETDAFELSSLHQKQLDELIQSNPGISVTAIFGYCDETAPTSYNDSLSLKRAKSVGDFLLLKNILASKVEIGGKGEIAGSDLRRNRKVEITYIAGKQAFSDKVRTAAVGDKIKLENLNFFNMSDVVVPKSRPVLNELLKTLQENPKLRIEIQGHICCQPAGSEKHTNVSTQRAKAVYDFLVKNGIDSSRLAYKGFGVTQPLHPIPEKNEQEAEENRRVEIEVISN